MLSKARKRWGAEVFERLFARSVEQCVEAGLVDGNKLYIDASLVAANASRNSLIEVVVRREVSKLDEKEGEQDSGSAGSVNRKLRSTTDPDSTVVRHQHGKPTPSYKNHRALDDKAGVVTAVKPTTGAIDEASELFELIERHEQVTASKTRVAVADSRYGNTANLIALAQRQIGLMWPICAANCAIRAVMRSIRRSVLFINAKRTATGARRERSSLGTTLLRVAAITSIAPRGEPARGAGSSSSARVIETDAPSSATRARNSWTKRASNPIPRKLVRTEGVGSGFKSATSPSRPFTTVLSELAGADSGGKAFRITSSPPFKTSSSSPGGRIVYSSLSVGCWPRGPITESHLSCFSPQLIARGFSRLNATSMLLLISPLWATARQVTRTLAPAQVIRRPT